MSHHAEEHDYPRTPVLDHGYLQLVEVWGSDENIIRAARMSTQKGFLGWHPRCPECVDDGIVGEGEKTCARCGSKVDPGDQKLLNYLWTNDPPHAGPFEMAGAIFEVQAPIMVFREWHRHRTQSYNEASARYAPLPDLNYVPTVERLLMGGGHLTKQAGTVAGAGVLTPELAECYRGALENAYAAAEFEYQDALKLGVPKELARLIMPVGRYSKMRASANLLNWTKFLTLRHHPKAQWEIQQYALAVANVLAEHFPRTIELWRQSRPHLREAMAVGRVTEDTVILASG